MLFNSSLFVLFFLFVYLLYVVLKHRSQNYLLLASSYVFYGAWDWRFLGLILISTLVDYFCGIEIEQALHKKRKHLFLMLSLSTNVGILFFFKYFAFFSESFVQLFGLIGVPIDARFTEIILPVGISFYTFQTMSYTIDIYRTKLKARRNFLDFALFVSFFPQLVAGPIERAKRLLPQIESERQITYQKFSTGAWLILLGFFKKLVLADNMATISGPMFRHPEETYGIMVLVGIVAFAFQIYGDFSGYSDIARGLSKLLGFELMVNFRMPYFATNPQEFWKRWHISLSSWLRDYLYIPLGGNKGHSTQTYRNLILTMLLGGLWHGASWHFVAWGGFHGLVLIVHRLILRVGVFQIFNEKFRILKMVGFFALTCFGWLLFAVQDLSHVGILVSNLLIPYWDTRLLTTLLIFGFTLPILFLEIQEERTGADYYILSRPKPIRLAYYGILICLLVFCGTLHQNEFIYFQF